MRVLVTGGAGFIGSHTVDALLARGHAVRVLDSLEPPVHTGTPPAYLPAEVDFLHGSVTDRSALRRALDGVDAVFHFAAYQDYLTDFSRFFVVNAGGTALLYELIVAERLPIRKVVVASSQAVYGEGAYRCPRHGVVHPAPRSVEQLARAAWDVVCPVCGGAVLLIDTDETVVAPHNSYALSKRDQEEIALTLGRRYGIPSVALRYSIVQGPRQSFRNTYSGALRAFTVRALAGRPPVLYEDGRQLRDYVAVEDAVRANLLVFGDARADGVAFNVGSGRRVTVCELAALVLAITGQAATLTPAISGLYRIGDTRHICSDISRLRALGWEPAVSQEAMARGYVVWAAAQPDIRDTFADAEARMRAAGVLRQV